MTDFTCNFKARVLRESDYYSGTLDWMTIQCANEPNHSGDHLILVPR